MNIKLFPLLSILLFTACNKATVIQESGSKSDAPFIKIEKPLHFPDDIKIDILHTKLKLAFDWQKTQVIGEATLTYKPYLDGLNEFYLDAKNFELESISIKQGQVNTKFKHKYDGERIHFTVNEPVKQSDVYELTIKYTSIPQNYLDSLSPEDKGLYFVDPLDTVPYLMPQIWTQGEPKYNSVWYPTLDRPDEKFTQEIYLTVDTSYKTLSNGNLVSSTFKDNLRTDYWHLNKPHSSYLSMIAIGDWDIVKMEDDAYPLFVYSEMDYSKYAKNVFASTGEMIQYFEKITGVRYPWERYTQIPVRNFVTGAMENTSASVFMENVSVDSKSLADENYDWIISHELSHQWFGDLVTTKSWSYVTLNEAFANYAEFLWSEYKYGDEASSLIRINEKAEYFHEAGVDAHPIIRFRYLSEDELFDAHTYSKGGMVLHMLRNELGNELFFKSLNKYLVKYSYKNAELSDLRKVFEEASGKNLERFFWQWFIMPGHPILKIKERNSGKNLLIDIEQVQEQESFYFPLDLRFIYPDGSQSDTSILISEKITDFVWNVSDSIGTLIIDPNDVLLAEISHEKTYEDLRLQFMNSKDFHNHYNAFIMLIDSFPDRVISSGLATGFLDDTFYTIREMGLNFIEDYTEVLNSNLKNKIIQLAKEDPKSYVRGAALEALMSYNYDDTLFYEPFLKDTSWYVNSRAFEALMELKLSKGSLEKYALELSVTRNPHMANILAEYYANDSIDNTDWFMEKIYTINSQNIYSVLSYFGLELDKSNSKSQEEGIALLYDIAVSNKYLINRVMAFQSLIVFADRKEVKKQLIEILNREDSQDLKNWFKSML